MPLVRKPAGAPAATIPAPDRDSVLAGLASPNDDERWAAARASAACPGSEGALGQALAREPNPRVREAMFTALARLGTAKGVEVVLPLIRSDDASVRSQALDALGAMKDAAWPYLPALLADSDSDVRILACELAREMPSADAVRLFSDLLDTEPEPNVCASAIEVLAEIGTAAALPALERCRLRFASTPFLAFSIKIAADRIRSGSPAPGA